MIQLRHTTSFFIQPRMKGDSFEHLLFRAKWNGSRSMVSINVGFTIDPDGWSTQAQRCLPRTFHGKNRIPAATINREIGRFDEAAEALFEEYAAADLWPSPDRLRTDLRVKLGLDAPNIMSVEKAYDEFLKEGKIKGAWAHSTVQQLDTVKNYLFAWKPQLIWEDFDERGLLSFLAFLREDAGASGLRENTVKKRLGSLKWFLTWAYKNHYLKDNTFEDFDPSLKLTDKRVIFLSWEELMRVWEWEPSKPYLGRVRDVFCFCAFTSLRFSDAQALRWCDVTDDCIYVTTVKTVDPIVIDLNKWSKAVLDKYRGKDLGDYRVLPKVSNQVCNRALKIIMKEVGLKEPIRETFYKAGKRVDQISPKYELIGTHSARRTFICNAIMMGIPPTVVMKWTGHSDYDAMKPYIEIADAAKKSEMSKFDKK